MNKRAFPLIALLLVLIIPVVAQVYASTSPIPPSRGVGPLPVTFNPIWDATAVGGYPVTCNESPSGCTACDALKIGINVTNSLTVLIFPLVSIVVLYGAFLMIVSGGSQERFSSGKRIVTGGLIGLAIVLCSWLIVNVILNLMAPNASFLPSPWNQISC